MHRGKARYRGRLAALACLLGLAAWAEAARPPRGQELPSWPPGEPRVRLERILGSHSDLGRFGLLRRLAGRPDQALFQRPFGIAWDGEDLLVTDPGAAAVVRIDARDRIQRSPGELFQTVIGVAACADGLIVSDSRAGRVGLLDRDLRLSRWIGEELERPTGVACENDRVFIVETGRHRVLALERLAWEVELPQGARKPRASGNRFFIPNPQAERMFVWEPDRVVRVLGRRGQGDGEFNFPTTINSGLGLLWVGDTLNSRLQRFSPIDGAFAGAFGRLGDAAGEMPRLKGVAIDAAGNLWVSDAHLDQVAIYRADGTFLMSIGGRGAAPGEFSFPAGIAAHRDGRVAVVDSLNRRIQIFRLAASARQPTG